MTAQRARSSLVLFLQRATSKPKPNGSRVSVKDRNARLLSRHEKVPDGFQDGACEARSNSGHEGEPDNQENKADDVNKNELAVGFQNLDVLHCHSITVEQTQRDTSGCSMIG